MTKAVVVDNDQRELLQTAKILRESDVFEAVIQFPDALAAAEYIEQFGCHVLFTEVEMKGMNGFELIERLRGNLAIMCIVILTNKEHYAMEVFQAGATDFILKPIDSRGIGRVVKKLRKNGTRTLC